MPLLSELKMIAEETQYRSIAKMKTSPRLLKIAERGISKVTAKIERLETKLNAETNPYRIEKLKNRIKDKRYELKQLERYFK